jgi:hypothetical protein
MTKDGDGVVDQEREAQQPIAPRSTGHAGVLCTRSRLGIMAVLTSDGPGGALARAQLPVAVITPIVFGWLRLKGQELRPFYE